MEELGWVKPMAGVEMYFRRCTGRSGVSASLGQRLLPVEVKFRCEDSIRDEGVSIYRLSQGVLLARLIVPEMDGL